MVGTGIVGLVGALIGASAAIAGGLMSEAYKRRRDRQGTASAFAGEIAAILETTAQRRLVDFFNGILPRLDAGENVLIPKFVPRGDQLDPVAEAFLDKIGFLPRDLPERVVLFYSYLAGIRIDIGRMANNECDAVGKALLIREDLLLWQKTEALGKQLVCELRQEARVRQGL